MAAASWASTLLALAGWLVGCWRWLELGRARRLATLLMGLSALCGGVQGFLNMEGLPSAWVGNVWNLVLAAAALPMAADGLELARLRAQARTAQQAVVFAWFFATVVLWRLPAFTPALHLVVVVSLAAVAALALARRAADVAPREGQHPAALAAVLLACCLDVPPYAAAVPWLALNAGPQRGLWTIHTLGWCAAYAAIGWDLAWG